MHSLFAKRIIPPKSPTVQNCHRSLNSMINLLNQIKQLFFSGNGIKPQRSLLCSKHCKILF